MGRASIQLDSTERSSTGRVYLWAWWALAEHWPIPRRLERRWFTERGVGSYADQDNRHDHHSRWKEIGCCWDGPLLLGRRASSNFVRLSKGRTQDDGVRHRNTAAATVGYHFRLKYQRSHSLLCRSIRMEGDLTSVKTSQNSQYALINHAPDVSYCDRQPG